MSSRTGWIAGAMVLAAIALVVLVRPAPPADSPAASLALPEPAVVPEQPRREVDEVVAPQPPSREPVPLPARAAAPRSEVLEAYRESARSLPANSAAVAPFIAANEASLSAPPVFAEFTAEPIDPAWAPRAQTELLSKLAEQPGLQLIALQVQCRTTMCQVQMTQPSSPETREPPMSVLNTLGMQPRFIMALKSQPSMQTSVAYLMRPGHAPPEMRQHAADPPERR